MGISEILRLFSQIMIPNDTRQLSILTTSTDQVDEKHNMFPSPTKVLSQSCKVGIETFTHNLTEVVEMLGDVIEKLPQSTGQYSIDILTFALSVNGSGKISLIGEIGAGVTSGITIMLKKRVDTP